MDKALELKATLETLGENWFNLKEQIKSLKLQDAPIIQNTKLFKGINNSHSNKSNDIFNKHEVEILIKLLPYFDVPLAESKKIRKESNELRKLLGLAKSEAEMIQRRKKTGTLIEIIKMYFDKLLLPETTSEVEQELFKCFYNNKQKTHNFV